MTEQPGLVILFGSGETSASGRKVWDWLFQQLEAPVHTAILETPAGFEPNSASVAGRIADFIAHRLQNFKPETSIIPARKRDTHFSPDNPDLLDPLVTAEVLFLGPGSPTYAVRQLEGSLAWEVLRARRQMGAHVILASATAVAAGTYSLPVYEIYKVGEDLHWHTGLDFLASHGLAPTFVPHWNNAEGGDDLDTSRCYMGQARFERLLKLLPADTTIVGIDEHTALVIDVADESCQVMGQGRVTVLRDGETQRFESGSTFESSVLGTCEVPVSGTEIHSHARDLIRSIQAERAAPPEPPPEVEELVERRQGAREEEDWATADRLRDQIEDLGWQVEDTPHGPQLQPVEPAD